MMEYDLACLNTIHDGIEASQSSSRKDGASMEARRKQRRGQAMDDDAMVALLKQQGIPVSE
jgi:hypothetical protein